MARGSPRIAEEAHSPAAAVWADGARMDKSHGQRHGGHDVRRLHRLLLSISDNLSARPRRSGTLPLLAPPLSPIAAAHTQGTAQWPFCLPACLQRAAFMASSCACSSSHKQPHISNPIINNPIPIMVFSIVRIEGIEGTAKPLIGLLTHECFCFVFVYVVDISSD